MSGINGSVSSNWRSGVHVESGVNIGASPNWGSYLHVESGRDGGATPNLMFVMNDSWCCCTKVRYFAVLYAPVLGCVFSEWGSFQCQAVICLCY